jgi:autotransporter adhesin
VGRYKLVDREVKNGFVYFYSVTAFDSTGVGQGMSMLEGRRSATEADGVVPQASVRDGKNAWVVPNPYRGYRSLVDRPSSWDLTPNGSDPTGTHIDFMGLPRGKWTIQVFTVSGDLVQTLRADDAVNESIRTPIVAADGSSVPGYNRQQDNPNDGQASWNLISRNGQDIVSGIYLFTVESDGGIQRGKFVVIR